MIDPVGTCHEQATAVGGKTTALPRRQHQPQQPLAAHEFVNTKLPTTGARHQLPIRRERAGTGKVQPEPVGGLFLARAAVPETHGRQSTVQRRQSLAVREESHVPDRGTMPQPGRAESANRPGGQRIAVPIRLRGAVRTGGQECDRREYRQKKKTGRHEHDLPVHGVPSAAWCILAALTSSWPEPARGSRGPAFPAAGCDRCGPRTTARRFPWSC